MAILLLTTGGTIDAAAYPDDGPAPVKSTVTNARLVEKTMAELTHGTAVTRAICDKDSKDLTPPDLKDLFDAIDEAACYSRIVVTTGTDRMGDIARMFKASGITPACPVVFTGAMVPLANGARSDGFANLKRAAFDRPDLILGTYIAMGDVFDDADVVFKDFEKQVFVVRR